VEAQQRSNKSGSWPIELADHFDFSLVQPHPATLDALVDFHVMVLALLKIASASRTLVKVRRALAFPALIIELRAALLHQLGVETHKVLVFVPAGSFFRRHVGFLAPCAQAVTLPCGSSRIIVRPPNKRKCAAARALATRRMIPAP
jgi:hypothetical protein